jgi:hypothetical protein
LRSDAGLPDAAAAALPDAAAATRERRGEGKAARKRAPGTALGPWDERDRGHDPVATILAQNQIRVPELVPLRHQRMAESPWTFYRGAAAVMAADLASRPHSGLTAQLCGDAHVINFGLWATPERNLSLPAAARSPGCARTRTRATTPGSPRRPPPARARMPRRRLPVAGGALPWQRVIILCPSRHIRPVWAQDHGHPCHMPES